MQANAQPVSEAQLKLTCIAFRKMRLYRGMADREIDNRVVSDGFEHGSETSAQSSSTLRSDGLPIDPWADTAKSADQFEAQRAELIEPFVTKLDRLSKEQGAVHGSGEYRDQYAVKLHCETVIEAVHCDARPVVLPKRRSAIDQDGPFYTIRHGRLATADKRAKNFGVVMRYEGLQSGSGEGPAHVFTYLHSSTLAETFEIRTVEEAPGRVQRNVDLGLLHLREGQFYTELGCPVLGVAHTLAERIFSDVESGIKCTPRVGEAQEVFAEGREKHVRVEARNRERDEKVDRSVYHNKLYELSSGQRLPGEIFGSGDQTYVYLVGGYAIEEPLDPNVATRVFEADKYQAVAALGLTADQLDSRTPEGYVGRIWHDKDARLVEGRGWRAEMDQMVNAAKTYAAKMTAEQIALQAALLSMP